MSDPYGREAGAPSERAARPTGECVDCGRDEGHRWHSPGYAFIGDGMVHHKYNPNSEPFERLTPDKES